MLAQNVLQTIGNTPHIRLNRLFGSTHSVYVKSERANPGGSIKDRIALAMVEAAEQSGQLKAGGTIIEPTSGNTGVGLAMVAAVKGYKIVLVMPESMSIERRRLILAYGAKFELTRARRVTPIARATELVASTRRLDAAAVRQPGQHDVHARPPRRRSPRFHERHRSADHRCGHRRHINGCGQVLKQWPKCRCLRWSPPPRLSSAAASRARTHPGNRRGLHSKNRTRICSTADPGRSRSRARIRPRTHAKKPAGGIHPVQRCRHRAEVARPAKGATVLAFNYDTGERYLSIEGFLPAE